MDTETLLVGIDETGYGAIAGPITVCACIVRPEFRSTLEAMNFGDSKACTPRLRQEIATWIKENDACEWEIISESTDTIESIGPWDAVCKAGRTALVLLSNHERYQGDLSRFDILMDGKFPMRGIPDNISNRAMTAADESVLEVKVASILAKVHRDAHMDHLAGIYPAYEFELNKGYGIGNHLNALYRLGPVAEHRLKRGVWRAVKNYWEKTYLEQEPLPDWLADLNPAYASTIKAYRRTYLKSKRKENRT